MKLAVTKTFCKMLNKFLADNNKPYKAIYSTCNCDTYFAYIDAFNRATNLTYDYLSKTGTMRYIRIVYPDNYYAMDAYLTTHTLNRLYHPGMTLDTYFETLIDYIDI